MNAHFKPYNKQIKLKEMLSNVFKARKEKVRNPELLHDDYFETLVAVEYPYLEENGQTYLDYTGGNLYALKQLDQHHHLLKSNVFGNPHSTNPTSQLATHYVQEAREKVISFFNAEDYFCIFTQNASGALKIVGECYPFDRESFLLLLADNHNSVNGIREYCERRGGTYQYCSIQYEDLRIDGDKLNQLLDEHEDKPNRLFAFPAQSNVSGVKHDLKWIETAQKKGWDVMLDAAAFVPTSKLDLKAVRPDFVSVSFYKIFGYPTGLGCLFVRKDKFDKLVKPWFAGGTVTLASVQSKHHYLAENHERFENGTISYLDLPAITIGLNHIEHVGIDRINQRVGALMDYLYRELKNLKHDNGKPIVHIFGPEERKDTGGTMIMNFFDAAGEMYPFEYIEAKTNDRNISIRSGCFCNPGIDEINNCLTNMLIVGCSAISWKVFCCGQNIIILNTFNVPLAQFANSFSIIRI